MDQINITIIPVPNAIPDNNGPVCAGQPVTLMGSTDATGTTINYLWTGPNGYTSNQQNPTDATVGGTYTLQVIVDNCASLPAVTVLTIYNTPDATAQNGGPYCNGDTIQLFGNTSASGPGITYAWTGPNGYISDVQNPTDATDAGVYTLAVSAGNCTSPIDSTDVIFSTPSDALASNSGPYCAGDTINLFGSTGSTGNVISYTWTGPNGYQSNVQNPNDAIDTGQYSLIVSVDGCQSAAALTDVVVNPLPLPVIMGQDSFCTGFTSTLDAGAGYAGYAWDNASSQQTLTVSSTGTYHVTVTDVNGCKNDTLINVTEIPSLTPAISGALAFCQGSSTILDAGSGYTSYAWSTGQTTQSISVTTGGNVGIIVTDADGCSGSTNVTTSVNPNPVVIIGGSTTYCIGGSTLLDAGTGYASYNWSNGATTQTISVATPGIVSVDVIDQNGCAGSASVTVDESTSLHPVVTGSNTFCQNSSTTLNAGSGFATYLWSDGSTGQTLSVNTPGTYSVSVSDGQGCTGEATVNVTEVLPPTAVVQSKSTLCNTVAGGSVINLYSLVTAGDLNGTWQDI
ncbi:MAG TPA: hypothetical protein VJ508_09790, partial [Saprospiraceae bacterium]|nr:hypothetical protein [Saprospiraceae bacterium]